jgi:uncharacterized protein (TIGR02611 family)
MAATKGPPSDEPGAADRSEPGAADRDDRPEMVRKLQERKQRHKERGRLARIGVVVLGVVLVLGGIVLSGPGIPGPGFAVILVGLAFLALEFDRAERLLERVIVWADRAKDRAERATTGEKIAVGVLVVLAAAAAVAAALLWDIPFLPF